MYCLFFEKQNKNMKINHFFSSLGFFSYGAGVFLGFFGYLGTWGGDAVFRVFVLFIRDQKCEIEIVYSTQSKQTIVARHCEGVARSNPMNNSILGCFGCASQ
jgi:hypothetical protein